MIRRNFLVRVAGGLAALFGFRPPVKPIPLGPVAKASAAENRVLVWNCRKHAPHLVRGQSPHKSADLSGPYCPWCWWCPVSFREVRRGDVIRREDRDEQHPGQCWRVESPPEFAPRAGQFALVGIPAPLPDFDKPLASA